MEGRIFELWIATKNRAQIGSRAFIVGAKIMSLRHTAQGKHLNGTFWVVGTIRIARWLSA